MILSFAGRLLCVAAVMTGLIHLIVEGFFRLTAPLIVRMLESMAARRRERLLYGLQILPMAVAVVLTCAVTIPQYLHSETNHGAEGVSWLCFAGALVVGIWYGFTLLRGVAIAVRTVLFVRSCRLAGTASSLARAGTPILSYPGRTYSVALIGLFRPFILISDSLLGEGGLSATAIDVVLEHEDSHARQLDNWKLFTLFCVPSLRLSLGDGRTWLNLWRNAAEWAADDDAVRGDRGRVLVMAETLVMVARQAGRHPEHVCMMLECGEEDLVARIHRLIDRPKDGQAPASWGRVCGVTVGVTALVSAVVGAMLSSHDLLEHLLHLGQG